MGHMNEVDRARVVKRLQIAPLRNNPNVPLQLRDLSECAERELPPVMDEVASLEDVKLIKPQLA